MNRCLPIALGVVNVWPRRWFGLSLLSLSLVSSVLGQHVPELKPRPGEQRYNKFRYLASHNSYQVGSWSADARWSLTDQLDLLNVRQLELDVRWDSLNNEFWVQHICFDQDGRDRLGQFLYDISHTTAFAESFIWLELETTDLPDAIDCGGCDLLVSPYVTSVSCVPQWQQRLRESLLYYFGAGIYTANDFRNVDTNQWPSMQELIRRGKHIVIVANGGGFQPEEVCLTHSEVVLTNTGNQNEVVWGRLGDSKVARRYPPDSLYCEDTEWSTALNNGFTFSASNCPGEGGKGKDSRIHPPVPMYAKRFPFILGDQGTSVAPYRGSDAIVKAVQRIKAHQNFAGPSTIPLKVTGDTYQVGRVDVAVRITALPGIGTSTVRLAP